jgi:hypothetical protein
VTEPSDQPKPATLTKILRATVGWVLLVLGVAMLVLPGPGILFVALGLGLIDLPFSRRLRGWLEEQAKRRGWGPKKWRE